MKKKLKVIIPIVAVIAVIAAGIIALAVYNGSLIDVDNYKEIDTLMKSTQQNFAENEPYKKYNKTVSDEVIKKTEYYLVKNKDYAAVFYKLDGNTDVIILKKDRKLSNKYKVINSSSTDKHIEKYIEKDENTKLFALYITKNKHKFDTVKVVDKSGKKELFSQKINSYPFYVLFVDDENSNLEIQYLKNDKIVKTEKW